MNKYALFLIPLRDGSPWLAFCEGRRLELQAGEVHRQH